MSGDIVNSPRGFFRGRRVLVTGGTGFVGTHLVAKFLQAGAKVTIVKHRREPIVDASSVTIVTADLSRPEECARVIRDVEFVAHAAGHVTGAGASPLLAMSSIATNLTLTANVIHAAWAAGVERLLVFSSSTGYPVADHPVREEEMWSGPTHPSYFGYGWMRRYVERLAEYAASKSGMRIAIVRPTAVYGRHDTFDPAAGHVIPSLIHRAFTGENPFVVWGTGDEVRDFLHIDDFARGCLLALERHAEAEGINIGSGEATTIRQLVRCVINAASRSEDEIVFDPTKPTAIPIRTVDISRAREKLGFQPAITLAEGIADTVTWYRDSEICTRTRP